LHYFVCPTIFIKCAPNKVKSNYHKHGVRFEVSARVFGDPLCISVQDRFEHGEPRWQNVGMVDGFLLLLLAHTVHDRDDAIEVVRIISARRPPKQEKKRDEQG
jgi:uncharacterized protein